MNLLWITLRWTEEEQEFADVEDETRNKEVQASFYIIAS